MEGGLVKTLHPKIHAGLLAERGNPAHEEYLYKTLAQNRRHSQEYISISLSATSIRLHRSSPKKAQPQKQHG